LSSYFTDDTLLFNTLWRGRVVVQTFDFILVCLQYGSACVLGFLGTVKGEVAAGEGGSQNAVETSMDLHLDLHPCMGSAFAYCLWEINML
jgi:hypothetical protein